MKIYNALSKSFTNKVKHEMGGGGKSIDEAFNTVKNPINTNGHEYVDLGLSVKWATCNVGATKKEDEGVFFQFGGIKGHRYADTNTNNFSEDMYELSKICDEKGILKKDYDAVRANMGGDWRMPTKDELEELCNTPHEVTSINGVQGMMFTSVINGNQLFIPFMQGFWYIGRWSSNNGKSKTILWSSQVNDFNDNCAYGINFSSIYSPSVTGSNPRGAAILVRGVFKK